MPILAGWVINTNWVMPILAGWVINYNWVMSNLARWVINYNWVMSNLAGWVINYNWVMPILAGWVINCNWVILILAGWVINYNWVNSWVVPRVISSLSPGTGPYVLKIKRFSGLVKDVTRGLRALFSRPLIDPLQRKRSEFGPVNSCEALHRLHAISFVAQIVKFISFSTKLDVRSGALMTIL